MAEKNRRRDLVAEYKRTYPEAGVYRIVNRENDRTFLGSALNLPSVRSKMAFAKSTGTAGGLDHRLEADIRRLGIEAFSLEILEVLETRPEQTAIEIKADLAALEDLWREKFDPATLHEHRSQPTPSGTIRHHSLLSSCGRADQAPVTLHQRGHHHGSCR